MRTALPPIPGFTGEHVRPGDAGYDEARRIWNRMIDRRPALIALVRDVEDTRRALAFARDRGLPLAIRGGGHNVAGSALVDDGLVIDHRLRRRVRVDGTTGTVEAEPGALLGEMDAATSPAGVAVPIGINTTTGLAGLTLGGGIGWLMRAHGLTCDHLVAADLLTADGDLVRVDQETQPELLWALRGGGGNFGVVTRFVFASVPMPSHVLGGLVAFPMEDGLGVLRAYRELAAELPRSVTTIVALRTLLPMAPTPAELHGRRVVAVGLCSVGAPETDEVLHRRVRGLGRALLDTLERKPLTVHQTMFDASVPAGLGYYWRSHFLRGLPDELLEILLEHHLRAPQPWSYSLVPHLGGAIADVAQDATAYAAREAPFLVNINGVSDRAEDDALVTDWTRACFDAVTPFSTGGVYVNFVGQEGEDRVKAAYGEAYARLAAVKARWDPDNVFRVNQNVRPSSTP